VPQLQIQRFHEARSYKKGNLLLTSIVVSPRTDRSGDLSAALTELGHLRVLRTFDRYPSEEELERYIRLAGPAIVFIAIEDIDSTLRLAGSVDRAGTGAQVVVVGNACDPQVLMESMQAGIREVLTLPLNRVRLTETVARITEILERKPLTFKSTDAVFSFLPAKPGDGASTVTLNVASAIARHSHGKTLLADFDLNLGMVSFLLKITNGHSVLDALNLVERMDDATWRNLVIPRENLDVLCSGRLEPKNEVDLSPAEQVLHFARRVYDIICLDLSGNMEPFSLGLLDQSKEIFVVCTSDLASLHFARAKARFLRDSGYGGRSSLVINRSELVNPFSISELEKLVGLPVRYSLANNPRSVSEAMRAGTHVNLKCNLGRQFETLAQNIVGVEGDSAQATRKRRFIEYFAIVPVGKMRDADARLK
jgi:pilus assembly protein CpaE